MSYPIYVNSYCKPQQHVGYIDKLPEPGEKLSFRTIDGKNFCPRYTVECVIPPSHLNSAYSIHIVESDLFYIVYLQESLF